MSSVMTVTMGSAHSPTFRHFTYVTTHSPTLPSLYLRHSSFSNPSVALPTSQLILQPFRSFTYITAYSPTFRHFTYVTTHSPTLPSLYLRHSSFSNPYVASPTSQLIFNSFVASPTSHLIIQPFRALPTSQLIIQPFRALPTSQLILQPFRCFTYVTAHSPTLLSPLLRHRLFTYVTWQATHDQYTV